MLQDEPPAATVTTVVTPAELSGDEWKRLAALEDTIRRGLQSFVDVGHALLEIRDSRLYRASYSTFDAYCQSKWKISRSYATRIADAAATVDLLPIGDTQPANEAQVRPLTPMDKAKADFAAILARKAGAK